MNYSLIVVLKTAKWYFSPPQFPSRARTRSEAKQSIGESCTLLLPAPPRGSARGSRRLAGRNWIEFCVFFLHILRIIRCRFFLFVVGLICFFFFYLQTFPRLKRFCISFIFRRFIFWSHRLRPIFIDAHQTRPVLRRLYEAKKTCFK